jgi:predicted aconitase
VLLELILNGLAPAAIIVCEAEEILTLGALVAEMVFERTMPVLQVTPEEFQRLGDRGAPLEIGRSTPGAPGGSVHLDAIDRAMLSGEHGKAAEIAMRLLVRMAGLQGAERLLDVTQAHIDGSVYTGPGSLRFAQMMLAWGATLRVPTTLNAISVDYRRWRELGVPASLGRPATALADAYVAMGAMPSFTCAPYLLATAPSFGEQIGWGESNAVAYANSVLGARTMKYADMLDLCIAITGRAPRGGCHLDAGRRATLVLDAVFPPDADDSFWPLLGYCCGLLCGHEIPLIRGLETSGAGAGELKSFAAAFATATPVPMFHIAGVTPEAAGQSAMRTRTIGITDLRAAWAELDTAPGDEIGLVSLGNPHFSTGEFAALAALVRGRTRSPNVPVIITCGRDVHRQATEAGFIAAVEAFGAQIVMDTCWCMLGEPVVPRSARTLMTNSGKYAHYAPGLTGRDVRFGSLAACVQAACCGVATRTFPDWLSG